MLEPDQKVGPRAQTYTSWICKHAWWVMGVALCIGVGSALLASHLQLKTDFAELLPSGDKSVVELRRVQAELPGMESLIVNIYSDDRANNIRFADALLEKLQAYPKDEVGLAMAHIKEERAWFEARKGLYISLDDLQLIRDRLRIELDHAKHPLSIDLDAPEGESLQQIQKRLQTDEAGILGPSLAERFSDGYFATADGKTVSLVIMPPGGIFREHAGERLRNEVKATLARLDPAKFGIKEVGFSGDVESSLEERDALEDDLIWATSICLVLVCTIVLLFFGRWRVLPLLGLPAVWATLLAYGVAQLAFGYLNSSTAFLASIIVGNGVNFAIIQLARYEEERRRLVPVRDALAISVGNTVQATGIAAFAAAISYGSLTATQFRGFNQFGIIGGVGMVGAWVATMTLLPAIVWLMDRHADKHAGARVAARNRDRFFAEPVARLALKAPRVLVAVGGLMTIAALVVLPHYLQDPFEYNFRNLRSAVSETSDRGEGRWLKANEEVFGRALNPLVVLTHAAAEVEPTREKLWQNDRDAGGAPMLDKIVVLSDILPGTEAQQMAKLPVLREIREILTSESFKALPASKRRKLEPMIPPVDLQPVTALDLPAVLRRPFTQANGAHDRVVLVFPKADGYDPWNGRDMMRLSERVAEVHLPSGTVERGVGGAVIFTGMIRAIVRDGPLATLCSALGVIALVVVSLRRGVSGYGLVLGTLAAGALWTLASAAWVGMRINFLNFVALPVTLGIGVDYGINIFVRAKLEGPGRLFDAVRATGGAVALCSATTIIGYGALLVADNRGLRSFGTLAILGEIACLFAALVIMPAYLQLRENRRA